MQYLSREAILRMVGLHDAAHLSRQLNAIQLSMEEQGGKLVTYWTEIRKTEKDITLIAGRMDDAETDIAQLQVTAGQISASVSSLQTTVGGHTEQIGQLQITANSLTASVSSLNTTVSGHTQSIGQLQITANSLTASVSSISDTVSGHTTKIAALEVTDSSISNRVSVIEGDYVKEAEISLMVIKDGNGYISNASIKADNIDFTFTRATNFISGGQTVMSIDNSGNLWISGEYRGGTITKNVQIGTGTKKMVIEPTSTGARLVGRDGSTEVISVGFMNYGSASPYINLNNGASGSSYISLQIDYDSLRIGTANNYYFRLFYNSSSKISIHGNWSSWYKDTELSSINKGDVYVDGNGFLKVKDY